MVAHALSKKEEVTAEWLSEVFGRKVSNLQLKVIGTVAGESSLNLRVAYEEADGKKGSVVLKMASEKHESRLHGIQNGGYEREALFYKIFANQFSVVPAVHASLRNDDGDITIVMEDFPDAREIWNRDGCDLKTAKECLTALAVIQAPTLGDWMWAGRQQWLQTPPMYNATLVKEQYSRFVEKTKGRFPKEQVDLFEWFHKNCEAWEKGVVPPLAINHCDFRLGNILFTDNGPKVIDWATVHWSPLMRDFAYFLGTSLTSENRRAWVKELFGHYLDEIAKRSEISIDREKAYRAYCVESWYPVCLFIGGIGVLDVSADGMETSFIMLDRIAQQCIDVDAQNITTEDLTVATKPLVPSAVDDGLHPIARGENFNESYYSDVQSADAKEGIYYRYGRLPNQNRCSIFAVIMRADKPALIIHLEDAPLPAHDNSFSEFTHPRLWFRHEVIEPLKKIHVEFKGKAWAYYDAAAPLWSLPHDEEVEVEVDLIMENIGTPMTWRITPRWECPAYSKGTYKVAGETFQIEGYGQRDHSWGMRDWFSVDCMWAHMHFDDGTHIQCMIETRANAFGQGYIQKDGVVQEQTKCRTTENWTMSGIFKDATITIEPGNIVVHATPTCHSAHRFLGPEGRDTAYPRLLCKLETEDGRKGQGMLEYFFVRNRGPPKKKEITV